MLQAVAVAPPAGLVHQGLGHLGRHVAGERAVALAPQLAVECFLEIASHVLGHSLLGVLLHLVVDGGIDAQAVPVEVVGGAVALLVLVQPAVDRVVVPAERIVREVLRELVVRALGTRGLHVAAEHVAEIGRVAGVVVLHLEIQGNGNLTEGIALRLGQVAALLHLPDHEVAALQGAVGVEDGVVARGLVDHAHQQGGLLDREVGRLLGEVRLRGSLHAVGAAAEEDGVQVHVHDLVLGVVPLDLDGGDPLLELDAHHLELVADLAARIESLGELLGDGTAAALAGVPHQQRLEEHAGETLHVDARMLVEAGVLRGHGRLDQVRGELVIADVGTVLYMEGGEDLSVLGDDLGGQFVVRVLQLFERRDLREDADQQQEQEHQRERSRDQDPEPLDNLLFGSLFHRQKICHNIIMTP